MNGKPIIVVGHGPYTIEITEVIDKALSEGCVIATREQEIEMTNLRSHEPLLIENIRLPELVGLPEIKVKNKREQKYNNHY